MCTFPFPRSASLVPCPIESVDGSAGDWQLANMEQPRAQVPHAEHATFVPPVCNPDAPQTCSSGVTASPLQSRFVMRSTDSRRRLCYLCCACQNSSCATHPFHDNCWLLRSPLWAVRMCSVAANDLMFDTRLAGTCAHVFSGNQCPQHCCSRRCTICCMNQLPMLPMTLSWHDVLGQCHGGVVDTGGVSTEHWGTDKRH
jgi:hypothetical protein